MTTKAAAAHPASTVIAEPTPWLPK